MFIHFELFVHKLCLVIVRKHYDVMKYIVFKLQYALST